MSSQGQDSPLNLELRATYIAFLMLSDLIANVNWRKVSGKDLILFIEFVCVEACSGVEE